MLGRPLLDLGGDDVGRDATDTLAEAERGAAGKAEWQRGQPGGTGYGAPGNIRHWIIQPHPVAEPGAWFGSGRV